MVQLRKVTYSSLLRSVTAILLPKYEPTCSPGMTKTGSRLDCPFTASVTDPLESSLGAPVTTVYSFLLSSFKSSVTE